MKYRSLLLSAVLLPACSASTEMNVEVDSEVSQDSALYIQSEAYLNAHHLFDFITATLDCPDGSTACLLRIEANNQAASGAAASVVLYVATGVQPLPGNVDISGAYQYGVEPVTYAATEETGLSDISRRYEYVCVYHSGSLTLKSVPTLDQVLEGQFDLLMDCTEQLAPSEVLPARLKGTFSSLVTGLPY